VTQQDQHPCQQYELLLWIIAEFSRRQSYQQFLTIFWLKDNKVGLYVHVDVAAVIEDVSMGTHYPDVFISQGYSL